MSKGKTPRALRLHIALFGRRNVGKSSLVNAFTHQQVSIVSAEPGTTTDPVEKPMELLPLGPVVITDTAGLDDVGELGEARVKRSRRALDRADIGLLVATGDVWGDLEETLLADLADRDVAPIVVWNQVDRVQPFPELVESLNARGLRQVMCSAASGEGVEGIVEALVAAAPEDWLHEAPLLGDLVKPGELVVLVVPVDKEAPRGRLIMPQVQALRDLLDHNAIALTVKDTELRLALESLKDPPALVVTDSQAFAEVVAEVSPRTKMTSFSILMARYKGDLATLVEGALAIDRLGPGSRILVAESCSHHPIEDDIGRVKIPRWLTDYLDADVEIDTVAGRDFPEDPTGYDLVIQCGGCIHNRREMLARLAHCRRAGVPITNYGVAIAKLLGVFERALQVFPEALGVIGRGAK
jgi:[FeFe] hydrogenase H-cluster maturation GTPase HydF